jgi:lipid II:glycine glycyltransferase (peptidoglycan interpeptide bridge formation enzyme)
MIVIEKREHILFKIKRVWFSRRIFDVGGCDVVIFAGCKEKLDLKGFTRGEMTTSVIDLTQDIDVLWRNIKRRSREYINQAKREGIEVKINERFEEFYQILRSFNKEKGLAHLQVNLPTLEKGSLFIAELDGEILAGHVYLEGKEVMYFWRGASKRLTAGKDMSSLIGRASRTLHWEAIKYAKNKGIKEFDMGGLFAGGGDDYPGHSIDAFKENFGGKRVVRYTYEKHYNKIYTLGQGLYHYLKSKKFGR